jgi:hypothetical protein
LQDRIKAAKALEKTSEELKIQSALKNRGEKSVSRNKPQLNYKGPSRPVQRPARQGRTQTTDVILSEVEFEQSALQPEEATAPFQNSQAGGQTSEPFLLKKAGRLKFFINNSL